MWWWYVYACQWCEGKQTAHNSHFMHLDCVIPGYIYTHGGAVVPRSYNVHKFEPTGFCNFL